MPLYCAAICDGSAYYEYRWGRQYSDAPWESWHRHYGGGYSGSDPGGGGSRPRDPTTTLWRGSKNKGAVKRAQKHLNRWNIGLTKPKVDGDFGPTTQKAVKQFQITHGLRPDGVIGNQTWKK